MTSIPLDSLGLEWFNVTRPLTVAGDLHGRIIVLDFFTYCCINCMHILPDLEAVEALHPPSDGKLLMVRNAGSLQYWYQAR